MRRKHTKDKRLYAFTWFTIGLFSITALSQAKIQLVDRQAVLDRAKESNKFTLSRKIHAKRGAIFSSDNRPLAVDQDAYELMINFNRVPKTDAFFVDLSAATGIPATDFSQLALNGTAKKTWKEALSASQRELVQDVKSRWKADGVSIERTGKRAYPLGPAAAPIVGALMDDKIPLVGLEKSQNKFLQGEDGKTIGLTDRYGNFLPMRISAASTPKQDGENVILTIDSELQQEAAAQVKAAVEKNNADSGSAIISDPVTGDILAMASYPSFDPTGGDPAMPKDVRKSTKNPITQDRLEPGSMFKVLTLAKGLDMGKIDPEARINCGGALTVWAGRAIKCDAHHGNRAHGPVDAEKAIAKSCNVSAASWALRIGYQDMVKFIEDLGLLKPTGLGLPYEAAGSFNYKEYAKPLQLATVGFGQSITTTPMALSSAFGMIANHGEQMKPRLIKQIGTTVYPPVSMGRRISAEAADKTVEIMEAVVMDKSGTGYSLRVPGYVMGGKTGTAEKVNIKTGGGYVSNFVGYVPSPNPRAVILVMIDNPKNGAYYGAAVAGPVFESLAKAVIRRYRIPPNEGVPHKSMEKINAR